MDERRKYIRFPVTLQARYEERRGGGWKECSVIDISREGMGISIYSYHNRIMLGVITDDANLLVLSPRKKSRPDDRQRSL